MKLQIRKGPSSQFLPPDTLCYVFLLGLSLRELRRMVLFGWTSLKPNLQEGTSPWGVSIHRTRVILTESKWAKHAYLSREDTCCGSLLIHTHKKVRTTGCKPPGTFREYILQFDIWGPEWNWAKNWQRLLWNNFQTLSDMEFCVWFPSLISI